MNFAAGLAKQHHHHPTSFTSVHNVCGLFQEEQEKNNYNLRRGNVLRYRWKSESQFVNEDSLSFCSSVSTENLSKRPKVSIFSAIFMVVLKQKLGEYFV